MGNHRTGDSNIRQIAVLPYRNTENGQIEVRLITSRDTRRWVLPKGNRIRGLKSHEAASHEAFEEAGLVGIACPYAIGAYQYRKNRKDGSSRSATVDIFPFSVTSQLDGICSTPFLTKAVALS